MPLYHFGNGAALEAASYEAATAAYKALQVAKEQLNAPAPAERDSTSALAALTSRLDALDDRSAEMSDLLQQVGRVVQMASADAERALAGLSDIDAPALTSMAAQLVTESSRARTSAQDAVAQVAASAAEAQAAVTDLLALVEADRRTATEWREDLAAVLRAQATSALEDVKAEVEQHLAGLQEPVGITAIGQGDDLSRFWIETSDGMRHELGLARGPRGWEGAAGRTVASGSGGGGGAGTAAGRLLGAACTVQLRAGVETELKFSARTGTPALTLPADVDVRFRAISSADPDTWSSAMLSSAAARAVGAGQLTVAAELYGPTGDLDLLWRVDQNAAGSVQIFATSPVDCQLEATIASVTGV